MADVWFVLVPEASEMDVSGTVADAFIVELAQGSATANELTANYTGKVTVGGKSGYLRAGPFTTLAAAQAYLKVGAQSASVAPGVSINPDGSVSSSIPGLSQVGDFFGALTQASTWIRVAKVLVGGLLLVIGLVHITGADNAIASVARKVPLPV